MGTLKMNPKKSPQIKSTNWVSTYILFKKQQQWKEFAFFKKTMGKNANFLAQETLAIQLQWIVKMGT